EAAALDDFDVVIVRRPSSWADRWSDLTCHRGFTAIHADSLVYWEWNDAGDGLAMTAAVGAAAATDPVQLGELVREVFDGYSNHYAANPILDRRAALEGYVEWADRTASSNRGYTTISDHRGVAGFGVIDWAADPP